MTDDGFLAFVLFHLNKVTEYRIFVEINSIAAITGVLVFMNCNNVVTVVNIIF